MDPVGILKDPAVIVEALLPAVTLYVILAAVPLVLATRVIAPSWVILLFEIKLIFEPLAAVIAPDW